MTSGPFKPLLDRDGALQRCQRAIQLGGPLLRDAIDQATWILQRCRASAEQEARSRGQPFADASNAPILAMLQLIEMIDAVEVCIASSCVEPAKLQLRSAFEALAGLRFLTKDPADFDRRGIAWMIGFARERLRWADLVDPTTPRGRRFAAAWVRERGQPLGPLPPDDGSSAASREYLAEPHVAVVLKEFKAREQSLKRPRELRWYELFGLGYVSDLARATDLESEYLALYSLWSSVMHGSDVARLISTTRIGDLKALRDSDDFVRVLGQAMRFLQSGSTAILDFFRSGEPRQPLTALYEVRTRRVIAEILSE